MITYVDNLFSPVVCLTADFTALRVISRDPLDQAHASCMVCSREAS